MSAPDSGSPVARPSAPASAGAKGESEPRRKRSVNEIERDIEERSERLAGSVDELVTRMRPGRLARDGAQLVGSKLSTADGGPRLEVLGAAVGAVLVTGFLIWRARRRR